MALTIALVSTNEIYAEMLTEVLRAEGYTTLCCLRGPSAHDLIRQAQPALVVLDLWLEHPKAGEMVLALLRLDHATRHIPVLVCPEDTRSLHDFATRTETVPYEVLQKPFDLHEFIETVSRLTSLPPTSQPRAASDSTGRA